MKSFWILGLCLYSVLAFGEDKTQAPRGRMGPDLDSPAKFSAFKKEALQRMDENMQSIKDHRACVNDAKDKAAFMKCQQTMRATMKAKMEKMQNERKAMQAIQGKE